MSDYLKFPFLKKLKKSYITVKKEIPVDKTEPNVGFVLEKILENAIKRQSFRSIDDDWIS